LVTALLNGQPVKTTNLSGAPAVAAFDAFFVCGGSAANPYCGLQSGNATSEALYVLLPSFSFEDFFGTAPPTEGVLAFPVFGDQIVITPEPSTALLVTVGLLGFGAARRKRA
jgi:hypothetical protein